MCRDCFFILCPEFSIEYYTVKVNTNSFSIALGFITEIRNTCLALIPGQGLYLCVCVCVCVSLWVQGFSGSFVSDFQHCLLLTLRLMTFTWSQWGPKGLWHWVDYIAKMDLQREHSWNLSAVISEWMPWDDTSLWFIYELECGLYIV